MLKEILVVVMHLDHPLSKEMQVEPRQIDGENFISTNPAHSGALYQMVNAYLAETHSQPSIVQTATNILATMNLVGMGLGLSIVPRYVCHFQSSNVVFRPLPSSAPQIELLMAWQRENGSPALAQMIDLAEEPAEV